MCTLATREAAVTGAVMMRVSVATVAVTGVAVVATAAEAGG